MSLEALKGKTVYVAGPMSNIPQFNFPAFDEAAAYLRNRGVKVMAPSELDTPEEREAALASTTGDHRELPLPKAWQTFLARDIKIVCEVDAVVCLEGWHLSKGARLETYVAKALGKNLYKYPSLEEIIRDEYVFSTDEPLNMEVIRKVHKYPKGQRFNFTKGVDAKELRENYLHFAPTAKI